ncbi:MAG: hypothetical protein KIT58_04715 [Planctomycetota bacterium]|nr:hypothetical protein [Planctomycetota bacterium]
MTAHWNPIAGTEAAVNAVMRVDLPSLGAFVAAAALLYGPLVLVRGRGSTFWADMAAMLGGGLVWLTVAVVLADGAALTTRPLFVLVLAHCIAFPVLLRLADQALVRVLGIEGRQPSAPVSLAQIALALSLVGASLVPVVWTRDQELELAAMRLRALTGTPATRFALAEALTTTVRSGLIVGALSTPEVALWTPATCLLPRLGFDALERRQPFLREALAIHERLGEEGHGPSMARAAWLYRTGGRTVSSRDWVDEWLPVDDDRAEMWKHRAREAGEPVGRSPWR